MQWIGPRLALNLGWLKLMAAAAQKDVYVTLRETRSPDPAVARAERRQSRKATKAAQIARIGRLVAGQLAPARPSRQFATA